MKVNTFIEADLLYFSKPTEMKICTISTENTNVKIDVAYILDKKESLESGFDRASNDVFVLNTISDPSLTT
jgi:hypothetical protein